MILKLAGAALLILSSAAYADDAGNSSNTPKLGKDVFGYFDLHAGLVSGFDIFTNYGTPEDEFRWQNSKIGGAARFAFDIDRDFSLQSDAWANKSGSWASITMRGAALHATFDPTGRDQFGPLASIGGEDDVDFAAHKLTRLYETNFGLEWAHNADKWRFYAQVGYASNIDGMVYIEGWDPQWWHIPISNPYAAVVGTYYFTPDLAFSAKLAVNKFMTPGPNWANNNFEVRWGAKLEYRPPSSPVIGYVAYTGRSETFDDKIPAGDDGYGGHGIETIVVAGFRIPFGEGTIQSLYKNVGLADLNPAFGDSSY